MIPFERESNLLAPRQPQRIPLRINGLLATPAKLLGEGRELAAARLHQSLPGGRGGDRGVLNFSFRQ
jgi:hypothetical protein